MSNINGDGEKKNAPNEPQRMSGHQVNPSHLDVILWSYLPAVLIDIVVTLAVFFLAEAMLNVADSYLTSHAIILIPILTIAGKSYSIFSVIEEFLLIWLLCSIIAIVVRHILDILELKQNRGIQQ